jgi:hypothetical protein
VFAVDVTTWPRCDAECSPERGYYYHWITQLSFDRDSWTAPVDARRLHPLDDTDQQAAIQIRALLARLPTGGPVPLVVFDGGHDSAQLTLDLAEAPVAVLVRLRSNRCFYADPPPRGPGSTGRPRRHGAKFNLADPTTWSAPTTTHVVVDDQYGTVTVKAWTGLHPKQQRHPGHGSRGPRPIVRGTIIRVQVDRVPARTRPPKVLWLWWSGSGELDLDLAWQAYIRRFDRSTPSGSPSRPRLDDPASPPARASRPLDLAGAGRLHPAAPGPPDRHRRPAAVGAAPTPTAAVTTASAPRLSAASRCARLAGRHAETLQSLPRPAQGPALGARDPLPSGQEARQEAKEQAAHDGEGRLTGPARPVPADLDRRPAQHAQGLNQKLSTRLGAFQAEVACSRSTRTPRSKRAPARTSATKWGALTERQRS